MAMPAVCISLDNSESRPNGFLRWGLSPHRTTIHSFTDLEPTHHTLISRHNVHTSSGSMLALTHAHHSVIRPDPPLQCTGVAGNLLLSGLPSRGSCLGRDWDPAPSIPAALRPRAPRVLLPVFPTAPFVPQRRGGAAAAPEGYSAAD